MVDIFDKMAKDYVEPIDLTVDELSPLFPVDIALGKINIRTVVLDMKKKWINKGNILTNTLFDNSSSQFPR